MKYIFMMVMLATVLFSQQQKQIILGSFSIESNALFYSIHVQKHVDSDAHLKKLMDKYSLKLEYKKVGAYNVVSISPFADYPSLFQTIAEIKKSYPQAYAINFPANQSEVVLNQSSTEPAIAEEDVVRPEIDKEMQETIDEVVKEEVIEEVAAEEAPQMEEPEIKYEPQKIDKPAPTQAGAYETFDLMMLVLLLLALIGFVVYKIQTKKPEELPEELPEED